MLSISTATVHESIRPKTPESSPSPPSQGLKNGRSWNCDYPVFAKRRCRPSPARKKIIPSEGEEATIGIDVHCQTVRFDQTPLIDPIFIESKTEESIEAPSTSTVEKSRSQVAFFKRSPLQERTKVSRSDNNEDTIEKENENTIEDDTDDKNISNIKRPKLENNENGKSSPKFSKMENALKFLKEKKNEPRVNEEEFLNPGIPGILGEDIPRKKENNFPPVLEESEWDSETEITKCGDPCESVSTVDINGSVEGEHFFDNSSNKNEPYYMIGFPNPPGENRCWLNATLHALFSLPLIDHIQQMEREQWRECSQLTKTFLALKLFWTQKKKQNFYQTVKLFKESLGILDESYPSQRQQDVSEFLTMFLNYLKTEFEKLCTETNSMTNNDNTENITNNHQEIRERPRSPHTPSKRQPLADISPVKRKFSDLNRESGIECSPKSRKVSLTYTVRDLASPRVNRLSNPTDPSYKVHTPPHNRDKGFKGNIEGINDCKNPIDRYFLLHMMEHYVCKGCAKHRQRKVDNLMLYVDLMHGSEIETVSLEKSIKTTREPEERTLTCGKCKYGKHTVFTTFRYCPKILMVQINRYGMSSGYVTKFNTPVEIPETLEVDLGMSDVENGNGTPESFEPVCVIAHVGSAMDCGHYTSYVKHEDSWYHYNDLVVTPMSRHEALTAAQTTAYVVFFTSTKPSSTG